MTGLGILGALIGVVLYFVGANMNNSAEVQFRSFFDSGYTNPGDIYKILGVAIGVLGVILLIAGLVKSGNNGNSTGDSYNGINNGNQPVLNNPINRSNRFDPVVRQNIDIPSKQTRICSNCGHNNLPDSLFCPKCGIKLPNKRFCKNCGTEMEENCNFCGKCGTFFVEPQENNQ